MVAHAQIEVLQRLRFSGQMAKSVTDMYVKTKKFGVTLEYRNFSRW